VSAETVCKLKQGAAVARNRQTEALASVIFSFLFFYIHHKHLKYLEFNHAQCLSRIFFVDIASVIILATALKRSSYVR